ncbi:MAG: SDR family NAD(P)-dependent oxidoreductase [Ilumatobacteraceae bacterium]
MQRFAGRSAIVTGASRGIGAAIAERLAAEGANLVITARTLDHHDHLDGSLTETLDRCRRYGGSVEAVVADLGDPDSRSRIVPEALEHLDGRVDILINNAAAAIYQSMLDYPAKRRAISFEVNLFAPLELSQAVIPGMVERGHGWIVNVSSGTARPAAGPPFKTNGVAAKVGMYGTSKAALNRMTNALALELHGTGVRVNTIEPRAAVASEGAMALLDGGLDATMFESMEAMVEGTLALCDCDADNTGRSYVSLDMIESLGLDVCGLDGRSLS